MFFCLLCHGSSRHGRHVCPDCNRELPWLKRACRTCAEPLRWGGDQCQRCLADPPPVDFCTAPFEYRFPVGQLILSMKQREPELLASLTHWLSRHLQGLDHPTPDLLVPVPMHSDRQRERGFNQAGVLAQSLGRKLGIPVAQELVLKPRATASQKHLNREERQLNLASAFRLDRAKLIKMRPRPRHIAIVDDVITTGATTAHLATLFKQCGIRRVDAWALAKTPRLHHG